MAIRQAAELSAAEQQTLFGWHPDPFGVAHLNLTWRPKETHLLLELDGQLASHVGMLRHDVHSGTWRARLAGIGGVITVPEAQGRGHASLLIEHAMHLAFDEWSVDAGLLFCLPQMIPYYVRRGWREVEHPVQIDQPSGPIQSPVPVMVFGAEGREWLNMPLALRSLPW